MHAKSLKEVFFSQSGMPENTTKMNEMFEQIFIENNFSQNDRKVFNLYFNEAKDYATIGKEIGLSRERIRVIFNKIVRIVSQRETLKRFFDNEQEFYNNLRKNKPFKIERFIFYLTKAYCLFICLKNSKMASAIKTIA